MRKGKTCAQMIMICLLLSACGEGGENISRAEEKALSIRTGYLSMTACAARLDVTADYGARVYEYGMDLNWKKEEGLLIAITAPEDLAGVAISVTEGQTLLEYDGAKVETGAITPGGLSPVDALPAFLDYAREGLIAGCAEEKLGETDALRVIYREPGATPGTGVEATLWFAIEGGGLLRGELSSDGAVVVQCVFREFQMA